jgi:hypothetical protein
MGLRFSDFDIPKKSTEQKHRSNTMILVISEISAHLYFFDAVLWSCFTG